jgi:hypothetical protein
MGYYTRDVTEIAGSEMEKIENPKEFAEWLRDIADHIEEGSPLIKAVRTENKPSDSGEAVKVIEIVFNHHSR